MVKVTDMKYVILGFGVSLFTIFVMLVLIYIRGEPSQPIVVGKSGFLQSILPSGNCKPGMDYTHRWNKRWYDTYRINLKCKGDGTWYVTYMSFDEPPSHHVDAILSITNPLE